MGFGAKHNHINLFFLLSLFLKVTKTRAPRLATFKEISKFTCFLFANSLPPKLKKGAARSSVKINIFCFSIGQAHFIYSLTNFIHSTFMVLGYAQKVIVKIKKAIKHSLYHLFSHSIGLFIGSCRYLAPMRSIILRQSGTVSHSPIKLTI